MSGRPSQSRCVRCTLNNNLYFSFLYCLRGRQGLIGAIAQVVGGKGNQHTAGLTAEPDAPAAKEAEAPQEDDPFASLFAKGEKK